MTGEWAVQGCRHVRDLGVGATGRVVLAVPEAGGEPVAIKYLSPQLLADARFVDRFREEARLLAALDDPNLVRFRDYVELPGAGAAIVMELVDGVSLADIINSEGATTPEAALVVLKGSLMGLGAAHRAGVVHRDYKPGNVLVTAEGVSKLTDFGIAVRAGDQVPAAGTPAYMAPEQWGGRPVSPATDVYAATVVFFECLTGEKPYPADTLSRLALSHRLAPIPVDRVPAPLRPLINAGMAKDPATRPDSASTLLGKLEAIALAEHGVGWEGRGRSHLAQRAALLAVLFPLARPLADAAATPAVSEAPPEAAQTFAAGPPPVPPPPPPPPPPGGGRPVGSVRLARQESSWRRLVLHNTWARNLTAGIVGLLLLAVSGVAVYAAAGDDKDPPKAALPTSGGAAGAPADDPASPGSPSATPSSPTPTPSSPSDTATPSAKDRSLAGGTTSRGGARGGADRATAGGGAAPAPRTATTVTGVNVSWSSTGGGAAGSYTVTTSGTGPITIQISYSSGGESRTDSVSGKRTYTGSVSAQGCGALTVTVSAGGVSDDGTARGRCDQGRERR